MDKKNNFQNATSVLQIIQANKKLTDDNYSKQAATELAQKLWKTIKPYVKKNISVYQNWKNQDYANRKKFINDVLNLLLKKFPGKNTQTPKIYFQEQVKPIWPHDIPMPEALFYSPKLNPWANELVQSKLGSTNPFFAFFHGFSLSGSLGLVAHEFTHYLQSIGQSSLSPDVTKQAIDYYQYYYVHNNMQIHDDSIHEYEARDVSKYINEQVKQLIATNSFGLYSNNNYEK